MLAGIVVVLASRGEGLNWPLFLLGAALVFGGIAVGFIGEVVLPLFALGPASREAVRDLRRRWRS